MNIYLDRQQATYIVNNIKLGPPFERMKLVIYDEQDPDIFSFYVGMRVIDVVTNRPLPIIVAGDAACKLSETTESKLLRLIRDQIMETLQHEFLEQFMYEDKRIFNPHDPAGYTKLVEYEKSILNKDNKSSYPYYWSLVEKTVFNTV